MKDITILYPMRFSYSCYKCSKIFEQYVEDFSPVHFCSVTCKFKWSHSIVELVSREIVLSWGKELLVHRKTLVYDKSLIFDITKSILSKNLYISLLAHEPAQFQNLSQELAHTLAHTHPIRGVSHEPAPSFGLGSIKASAEPVTFVFNYKKKWRGKNG